VDFCDGLPLFDEHTGEHVSAELFVGARGASSYTFAWATFAQDLPTWLDCHVRTYEFFSGVSAIAVPDFVPGNRIWKPHPRHCREVVVHRTSPSNIAANHDPIPCHPRQVSRRFILPIRQEV
jgi:transposase